MTNRLIISILFILVIFGCQQNQVDKTKAVENSTKPKQKQYPEVDTSRVFISDVYYQFVRLTDSTSTIKWGNKLISNICLDTTDNFFFEKERVHLKWSNDKFIALGRGLGSDSWINIILPLKKDAEPKSFDNPLAIDEKNGIIVCEYYSGSDTILIAENIITGEKQAIGRGWKKCSSAFYHYCVDSISISNKILFVKWTTPNEIDTPNNKEIKRVKLNL